MAMAISTAINSLDLAIKVPEVEDPASSTYTPQNDVKIEQFFLDFDSSGSSSADVEQVLLTELSSVTSGHDLAEATSYSNILQELQSDLSSRGSSSSSNDISQNSNYQTWPILQTSQPLATPAPEYSPPSPPDLAYVTFTLEPPEDNRKLKFFSFTIRLHDSAHSPLSILTVTPLGPFPEPETPDTPTRNGFYYHIELQHPFAGHLLQHYLYIRLVDSHTHRPIIYEGIEADPAQQCVLVTHQQICSRCQSGRTRCGNEALTPSKPVIDENDPSQMTFYFRCNQNCVVKAGCPSSAAASRRFVVEVSTETYQILGYSRPFFIHNSSKRKAPPKSTSSNSLTVWPTSGPPGTEMILTGGPFTEDVSVAFNSQLIVTPELVTTTFIKCILPAGLAPGPIQISVVSGEPSEETASFEVGFSSEKAQDVGALDPAIIGKLSRALGDEQLDSGEQSEESTVGVLLARTEAFLKEKKRKLER